MKRKLIHLLTLALTFGVAATASAVNNYSHNVTTGVYANPSGSIANTPRTNAPGFQYDLYQAVNRLAGTSYTRNDNLSDRFLANPYLWQTSDTTTVVAIGSSAMNTNTLRYYLSGNTATPVTLYGNSSPSFGWAGTGAISNPYPAETFTPGTSKFGFSLLSKDYHLPALPDAKYYSEYAYNPGVFKYDHLMVYNMSDLAGAAKYLNINGTEYLHTFSANTYLMGWEDKPAVGFGTATALGDEDYNDLMFLVDLGGSNSIAALGGGTMGVITAAVPEPGTITLLVAGFAGLMVLGRRNRR